MNDRAIASLLTAIILALLAVWVPLLEAFAWFGRRRAEPLAAETSRAKRSTHPDHTQPRISRHSAA